MHESGVRGYGDVAISDANDLEALADEMKAAKVASVTPFELEQAARLIRAEISMATALEIVHGLVEHGRSEA